MTGPDLSTDRTKIDAYFLPRILALQGRGGIKMAQGKFSVPTKAVTLTSHSERSGQRPKSLRTKIIIRNAIYQQQSYGKNKKLVTMY